MPVQSGSRRDRVGTAEPSLGERVRHAADAVKQAWDRASRGSAPTPSIAVILGTGLNRLLQDVREPRVVFYEDIPHMPRSTAPTHKGQLAVGELAGKPVLVMDGRFHLYEGYTAQQVAFPIWVLKALGVQTLLVSNIAGGLNPDYGIGDLMLISDHINLQGASPLVGPNDDALGPRFPDMCEPYDPNLLALAERVGRAAKLPMRRGVYVALTGPQLETRAEYRYLRQIGADAVGMSTVPEVIAAVHAGLKTLAVSLVSDLCMPDTLKPVNIEELIAVATRAEPQLTRLFTDVIREL